MLSYIALLPGVWAFMVASKTSPQQAFIQVYIPCLLLLPDYYRAITPGIPDPTFCQSASVGLFIATAMKKFPGYVFSPMDLVVMGFTFCVGYSEYLASGYSDAQNLIFTMLFSVLTPYIYAKSFIEPFGNRFPFAKRFVLALFVVACANVYETRLGSNPWELIFGKFFPGQSNWVVTFRFGFARSAGPFGHALLAGIVFACGFRIQRWLEWSEVWPTSWPKRFKFLSFLPFKPARFLTLAILFGLITSFAKGSWLASIIATLIIVVGRAKNRMLGVAMVLAVIFFVLVPATVAFINYASVGRANAKDDNQETAAYRYELIQGYMDIAAERIDWGWGLMKWPTVLGMPSIDNHYLLLFLNHGRWAFGLFLIILLGMPIRLIAYAMRSPPPRLRGGSLPFTLAAIFVIYMINVGTVYLGLQTAAVLFMMTGWGESYIRSKQRDADGGSGALAVAVPAVGRSGFRRVL